MRIDASTPALVLRFHHGSLAIARSLGRLGVPVYGVDSDLASAAMATRYCRESFRWDFGARSPQDSVDFLLGLRRRFDRAPLLIPTSDNTAELVADHAAALGGHYLFPRQNAELVRAFSNKRELYYLARRVGVPTPETTFPRNRADVEAFARATSFPVMLKAADGLRLERRTGKKMVIATSPSELLGAYDALEDPDDPDLMLQEYIPGGDDTIWMFDGYFDEQSELRFGCTGRKLRQHPVHTGATSLGVLERNDTVLRTTVEFMKAVGYSGILDIGYRFDARDGSYKLLDPNPRIGSTFRLFVGDGDLDVARVLYLHLTGQRIPAARARYGRKWVIEDQDLFSCREYRREGQLPLGSWLRSYRGVREAAWFAADDLRPFLRMSRGVLGRALGAVRPARAPAPAPRPVPELWFP